MSQQSPTNQERDAAVEALITSVNRFRVREWTPQTIQNQPTEAILGALRIVNEDRPEFTNRILPPNMPPETFHNMILREVARRGVFEQFYVESAVSSARGTAANRAANDNYRTRSNFRRLDLSMEGQSNTLGENRQLNVTPLTAGIFDAAIDNLLFDVPRPATNGSGNVTDPSPQMVLRPDVVAALRLPTLPNGEQYIAPLRSDVARRTLGYALGSVSEYNPTNPNAQLNITLTPGITFGEVQPLYCREVQGMYAEGEQLNPRDALVSGFIQGRVNQREPMVSRTDAAIGIIAPCPTPAPARTGNQR